MIIYLNNNTKIITYVYKLHAFNKSFFLKFSEKHSILHFSHYLIGLPYLLEFDTVTMWLHRNHYKITSLSFAFLYLQRKN